MKYSRPWWFWPLGGFWAILIFLCGIYVIFAAIFTPQPFDQMLFGRVLWFSFGALIVGLYIYGLPRSIKNIEISGSQIQVNYLLGRKQEIRDITRIEAKLDQWATFADQAPTEIINIYHSGGKLVIYPYFFSNYRELIEELEKTRKIENREIL